MVTTTLDAACAHALASRLRTSRARSSREPTHRRRGHGAGVDLERCRVADPGHLLEHHVVQVDQPRRGRRRRVGPGQEQQVAHQPLHPVCLDPQRLHGLRPVRGVGVGGGDVELGADHRQRALQVVRGVGHEVALVERGALEPVEHLVHGLGESLHLVAGAGQGHPPVQRALGDLGDLGPDLLDRTERPPDDQPDRAGEQREHQRQPEQQQPGQPAGHLLRRLEAGPDVGRHRTVRRLGALPPEPVVLGLLVVGSADGADDGRRARLEAGDAGCTQDVRRPRQHGAVVGHDLGHRVVADRPQHLREVPGGGQAGDVGEPRPGEVVVGTREVPLQDRHQRDAGGGQRQRRQQGGAERGTQAHRPAVHPPSGSSR